MAQVFYVNLLKKPLIFFISEDHNYFYTVIINQDGKGTAGSSYIRKQIPEFADLLVCSGHYVRIKLYIYIYILRSVRQ